MGREEDPATVAEPSSKPLIPLALSGGGGAHAADSACGACGRECGGTDDPSFSFGEIHPLALHPLSEKPLLFMGR